MDSDADAHIEEANRLLRDKGYAARELNVSTAIVGGGKALLKGTRIVSPLSDLASVVRVIVERCVPPRHELGGRSLAPRELRDCIERGEPL
jgi:hypothetical protein